MQEKNFEGIVRGDYREIDFTLPGNRTLDKIIFVAKYDKEQTSDRIIEKKNSLAGGGDNEITVAYNSAKKNTKVVIKLAPENSETLTALTIYYDLSFQLGLANAITEFGGYILFTEDVQTDFDGTSLPVTTVYQYVSFNADELEVGDMLIADVVDGELTFTPLTLTELKILLEALP